MVLGEIFMMPSAKMAGKYVNWLGLVSGGKERGLMPVPIGPATAFSESWEGVAMENRFCLRVV